VNWVDGRASASHPREPWGSPFGVLVHTRLETIKGTSVPPGLERDRLAARYRAAKHEFNFDAAFDIIDDSISAASMAPVADAALRSGRPLRLIRPTPSFDDDDAGEDILTRPTNAIPAAFCEFLRQAIGAEIDEQIVQSARVGRSKLPMFCRFLIQPSFNGEVSRDCDYVMVDDVFTTGGTFAALRSHIIRNGGTVAFGTALAHKEGTNQALGIAPDHLDEVRSFFSGGIDAYWLEATGHAVDCLTEAEARFLVQWGQDRERDGVPRGNELLLCLRTRINKAAATGE
jgi:hypothetical protein